MFGFLLTLPFVVQETLLCIRRNRCGQFWRGEQTRLASLHKILGCSSRSLLLSECLQPDTPSKFSEKFSLGSVSEGGPVWHNVYSRRQELGPPERRKRTPTCNAEVLSFRPPRTPSLRSSSLVRDARSHDLHSTPQTTFALTDATALYPCDL